MTADPSASEPASMNADTSYNTVPEQGLDYEGHDRNEVTRLITQALYDMGYTGVANLLEKESGLPIELPSVAAFRAAVLGGEWDQAEKLLLSLDWQPNTDLDYLSFLIRRQQYLELIEARDTKNALHILRTKLSVLPYDSNEIGFEEAERRRDEIHALTNVLMFNTDEFKTVLHWDGAQGKSRGILLDSLQELISADMMIPKHRLARLLHQAKQFQLSRANYRIDNTPFSLCKDFRDDRSKFPLRTTNILGEHTDEVWFLAFSHDGKFLASASKDKTVIVWNLVDFTVHTKLEGHTMGVLCVDWSWDDKYILSSSQDRTAIIWDADTGKQLHVLKEHEDMISSCQWIPNDNQFVVTSSPDRNIIIWDFKGNVVHKWHGIRVLAMAITPDAKKLIALESEKNMHVFNLKTREKIIELETAALFSVTISRDSRYALVNLEPDGVQLWDLETYKVVRKFQGAGKSNCVMRSCFGGPDENIVMSGSADSRIYVWNRETKDLIEVLAGHVGIVNCVRFNPTVPTMFASCSDDGKVRIWQP